MNRTVQLGHKMEATAISNRGGEGGHRQRFHHLWAPPVDGELLLIPVTGDIGGRKQMDGVDKELFLGKDGSEEDNTNTQQVGGRATGVRILLKRRGADGAALPIRDLGGHPPHGQGPGEGFIPRGQDD